MHRFVCLNGIAYLSYANVQTPGGRLYESLFEQPEYRKQLLCRHMSIGIWMSYDSGNSTVRTVANTAFLNSWKPAAVLLDSPSITMDVMHTRTSEESSIDADKRVIQH